MPLKTVEISNWLPDTGYLGMRDIQGLVPTENGYSGIGQLRKLINAPASVTGTPIALFRSSYDTGGQLFLGTTGATTNSHIYVLAGAAFPAGSWTDRLSGGAADADWHFGQFGDNTLVAGGTAIRLKVSTPAVPDFTDVTSNISPKFITRFGNRIFAANLSWNIAGVTTVATSGTEPDYVFASNYNDVGVFGDAASSPGLGAAIFLLRDEYGPITGIAATESYILVTKKKALIIGRRSTAYDIDWNYLGARFGCVHPRSIVVDGEDIYLWANCGPICVVAGNEIEQIGPGRISHTVSSFPDGISSRMLLGVTVALGSTYYPIYASQDAVSGIVNWHFSPGTETLRVASMELDAMVHYDPDTKKLSNTYCDSATTLADGVITDLDYKAVCSAIVVPTGLNGLSPIGNVLFARSNGEIWQHENSSAGALTQDPHIQTQWFAGDDGGNFRIAGLYFQFPGFDAFGQVAVYIDGIMDRKTGFVITEGPFTGIDPQGKLDTAASSSFQLARIKIVFGKVNQFLLLANAAQITRNIRLFEVVMVPTTQGGSR